MKPDLPETCTLPEFGPLIGKSRPYSYQLKKEGRLVFAADGKTVRVAESILRVAATKTPSHQGVADRHEAARIAKVEQLPAPKYSEYDYQESKAKKEHFAAEKEQAEYLKSVGQLVELSQVVATFANAGTILRSRLESWQAILPPQLAGRTEAEISTTLADQVERLLIDLVSKFNALSAGSRS